MKRDRWGNKRAMTQTPTSAFLSSGHRPFFLAMSAYGALALGIWVLGLSGYVSVGPGWHGHEMIFGFAVAAMAGFLLTAVPNWTGRPPVVGTELLFLVVLWVLGRLAISTGFWPWLDCLFLPVLTARILYDIAISRNWRNILVPLILILLAGLNVVFYFGDPAQALRLSIYVITGLMALIGGRIVPNFTANALQENDAPYKAPRFRKSIDHVSIPSILVLVAAETFFPGSILTGLLAFLAASILLIRMVWWRTLQTRRTPLLWILHVGYIWIPIGYFLKALSDIWGIFDSSAALHALTTGSIGVMILAVSSRAALGHSGRSLSADQTTVFAYILVILAGAVRVFGPIDLYALEISGALWVLGFGLYTIVYWPILTKPRVHLDTD